MDIHYVKAPIPYLVEENFDGYFHDHDDLTISQILQDQEIVYQSLQRNALADTARSSSTASREGPGAIPLKESSSRTPNVESQLSTDEAYARELQELENQLSHSSIDGSLQTGIEVTRAQSSTASTLGSSDNNASSQVPRQDDIDPDSMTYEELQSLGEAIGTASRGLPDELISYLPTSTYKTGLFSKREKHEECVICYMAYKNRDKLIMLPCQHQYHKDCVTRWLKINKACPVCNEDVFGS
ncbi:E3 ubiquitin ligase BIG BROTHER [Apostasia shenzhenica]|uniref:E3 ubiquitin ligase BIG BROTHER n=1 Tax=Apostasia shenzhenica TaxID=1088818 RepID=A0A2I0AF48_9ASPA|nr:E3 ubiquitin ligase BIG BROTHER [Apostasia shenzhenica]